MGISPQRSTTAWLPEPKNLLEAQQEGLDVAKNSMEKKAERTRGMTSPPVFCVPG
jgi:hypothetical protein